ncbi:hypothetical protein HDF26_004210 [Pedobacter cryoconitis]|uniref:Uncharacterized protein n=1 Tax=Pedobacter cryoconitis TaxID=188932 RepID=A0A7W8ZK19_9SPHI|nr:hypothetical protein [Pedobacter cryoconitis]MBB5635388.1 hypothetical protein [Pedobacter cryoconitis]MBB6273750.1 hypothetical protein [Pedobacter cryoconitis]
MKNLFNVSPFILLLIPVFVLMVFTVMIGPNPIIQDTNTAAKTTINTGDPLVKTNLPLSQ